jgi:hypothetical protein
MAPQPPEGPFCQSCGMPMSKPEDFGINTDGSASKEYCNFCFQNGKFTDPNITMQQMIEKVAGFMVLLEKMPGNEAERLAKTFIPKLKRWQSKSG